MVILPMLRSSFRIRIYHCNISRKYDGWYTVKFKPKRICVSNVQSTERKRKTIDKFLKDKVRTEL